MPEEDSGLCFLFTVYRELIKHRAQEPDLGSNSESTSYQLPDLDIFISLFWFLDGYDDGENRSYCEGSNKLTNKDIARSA